MNKINPALELFPHHTCTVNWVGMAQRLWSSSAAVCSDIRYNRSYRDCTVAQSYSIASLGLSRSRADYTFVLARPCVYERGSVVIFNLPLLCPCPRIVSASHGNFHSLTKKGPWAVHLTLGLNRGVGRHSSCQYCVLLSAGRGTNSARHCGL